MNTYENIALFDMDGTLFDHDLKLREGLDKIKGPNDPLYTLPLTDESPEYLKQRSYVIRAKKEWWANLPKFQLGWDVFEIAQDLEFKIKILTQCPKRNPDALSGKKECINTHLGYDFDITLTRNKGDVFGKVLVDDYPDYILSWLKWRKRGLVIMPANEGNKNFKHSQVIRYDGSNLDQVKEAMKKAKERKPSEFVDYK